MPLDKKRLLSLCERIAALKSQNLNEEDTRGILIDPMLQELGWNIFDVNEISRNSKTTSGKFIDYILKFNGTQIYLEAKPLSSKLTQKFQVQATNYAYEDNITFCVLTNGNRYQIFETFKRGTVSERLIIDISLDDEKISLDKKVECLTFISKESIKNGDLESFHRNLNGQNELLTKIDGTDKPLEFKVFILTLREKILALGKDITEVYYHQHCAIGFKQDTEFASMKIRSKNNEIILFLRFGEFEPNLEKFEQFQIERLPNKLNLANNIYKVVITRKEQIEEINTLIKLCYDLRKKRV
ncbi:MAG: hypothetical protein ACFFCV_04425 [Promethearchaeota archaeon]